MSFQRVFVFSEKQGETSFRGELKPTAHKLYGTARQPQTGAGQVLALCYQVVAAYMPSHPDSRFSPEMVRWACWVGVGAVFTQNFVMAAKKIC